MSQAPSNARPGAASIFDMFRKPKVAEPVRGAPAAGPAKGPANTNPGNVVANVNDPGNTTTTTTATTTGTESPLDRFKDLWHPNVDKDGKPVANPGAPSKFLNFDMGKMQEAISKMDFSASVKPEVSEAALKGDSKAFMEALNSVSRATFLNMSQATTHLMEQALQQQQSRFDSTISDRVRQVVSRNALLGENPAFKHPAFQPVVEALEQQFRSKFPQASPDDIRSHTMEYLKVLSSAMSPATEDHSGVADGVNIPGDAVEVDWGNFFGMQPNSNAQQ